MLTDSFMKPKITINIKYFTNINFVFFNILRRSAKNKGGPTTGRTTIN